MLFIVVYGILYAINYILTGLTVKGGYYWSWLDDNLDYISAFRHFLLKSTGALISLLGYNNYVDGNILWVQGGRNIRMVYSCIGMNILCMWWAFVIAFPMQLKRRVLFFITGSILLVCLNILRLSLLTITHGQISILGFEVDHHTVFNATCYILIFLVIRAVINKELKNA